MATVRLEGCSNRSWELVRQDGGVEKYYSVEGSPQREGDDERVFDFNPDLGQMLEDISEYYPANDNEVVVFSVRFGERGFVDSAAEMSRITVDFVG